ncbi:hypothetical protein [Polyangium mundeleinium]|uniref:Uncharacterized protein n=1 Tax=Polyangium mundeleinium TaxID=2995306 RepID=A0ABT5ELB4_9BACT|nr:hypothetical protein [Polyangium mundeleinium]MDC0742609.1 hypothetical protein [Polyangium mundeleinium]
MTEHDQDHEPPSIPGALTADQQARVRKALASYACSFTTSEVAVSLGYARLYVLGFLRAEIACSVHFAGRVADVVGVDLAALLGLVPGGEP